MYILCANCHREFQAPSRRLKRSLKSYEMNDAEELPDGELCKDCKDDDFEADLEAFGLDIAAEESI